MLHAINWALTQQGEKMKSTASSLQKLSHYYLVALTALAVAAPAAAQDDGGLEEIIVTAQKRAQNIMDVPVAITAVTGAQIEASGITDMFSLQQNVPGLIVGQSQTATTSNFAIRGVGSTSNNFGVESSVGLYVDGVYRSRQSSIINELVDVEAVEVLRGPQGTLFGKNTASGAIHIRTVAPSTDSTDAFFQATGGDYGLGRFSGAANIVLSDSLAFRGTVFSSARDGYVSDDNLGKNVYNDQDRRGVRLQLGYDAGNDFNMRIIADYSDIDEVCCVGLSNVDGYLSHGLLAQGIILPGADFIRALLGGTVYTDFDYPAALLLPTVVTGVSFEDYRTTLNYGPESKNRDRGFSVEMNKTLSNGMTLTSITAYRAFDTFDLIDADFTDTDILGRTNDAQQNSISQEFRLAGEFGEGSNWVAGAYYFEQEITSVANTYGGVHLQPYVFIAQPGLQQIVDGINFISFVTGGAIPPAADPFPANIFALDVVDQFHQSFALFGQVDWAISDALILTLGARYTNEDKDITATYTQTSQGPAPDLDAIGLNLFLASIGQPFDPSSFFAVAEPNVGWGGYLFDPLSPRPNVGESLSDDQVTGTAKLSWFPNDSTMVYASYASGFKAGGTNTDRIGTALSQTFGPETSVSFEVGYKGDIGDRFRVSVAAFFTEFDDFQANSFTGTAFNLQNAGKLETKGIEIEATWAPWDSITIQSYYAKNIGEYADFQGGTCWVANAFHTGVPDPGLDPATGSCVRTGGNLPYNPEDRFFVGLTQTFPMGNNELFVRAEYTYASDTLTDGDLDPLTRQDSFGLVNLRIGINLDNINSVITLWGRNITDERYYSGSFDPPLLDGRLNSYPSEPATYGITFRRNWD